MKKLPTNEKESVFIAIQYEDESEFHFNVEVDGKVNQKLAIIQMITRGTLMASNGVKAVAYNEEGFDICSYIK